MNGEISKKSQEAQAVLNGIRKIVKSIRSSSSRVEKAYGLSAAQLFVLRKLRESGRPLSINELAALTFTHQSSVSAVVSKLFDKGLLKRMRSREDSRRTELRLSRKGEGLLRGKPDLIQERLISAVQLLPPRALTSLVLGLNALLSKAGLDSERPSMFFERMGHERRR